MSLSDDGSLDKDLSEQDRLLRLHQAAYNLYMAGVWKTSNITSEEQQHLWENLRDGLGLIEGYSTSRGVTYEKSDEVVSTSGGWSSDYYVLPEGAYELGDLIEHKNMNFNVGNIFKACYRLGNKGGTTVMYDLDKIKFFAEREIKRVAKADKENR